MRFAPDALATWNEPLTPDERDQLLDKLSKVVVDRGLQTPAILALEMHKPLAFVASQTLVATAPLLGPLIGIDRLQSAGRLLQEPGGVEALIERIESLTHARDAQRQQAQPANTAIGGGI